MPANHLRGLTFHVVGGNAAITRLLVANSAEEAGMDRADIVIFQGGEDINPALYGEKPHPECGNPNDRRDAVELAIYEALDKAQYRVGICRGAQFLNVMNGGKLWQHIQGHGATHELLYKNEKGVNRAYLVSSTHHQMMRIGSGADIWGEANQTRTRQFPEGASVNLSDKHWSDPEIVFYKKTGSLCFQPHP